MASEKLDIIGHIADGHELHIFHWHIPLPQFSIFGIDMSITRHVFFMWLACAIMVTVVIYACRKDQKVPRGVRNLIEALVGFLRDFVAKPFLKEDTRTYLPFILTIFFFIASCNLIGLVPFGATPTGNIMVTGTLALLAFFVIQIAAVLRHGIGGYFGALVPHVPWWLWPMMFVVEVLGWFAKTMALAVRLFANMVGGHVILLGFLGLTFIFKSHAVGVVSVMACVALMFLEIFVALLQAFVFTFLTAVFLGMMLHPDH